MGNPIDPRSIRLPPKVDEIIREYSRKHFCTINRAIVIHICKGASAFKAENDFHIEDYTANFVEEQ